MNSLVTKCLFLLVMALIITTLLLSNSISIHVSENYEFKQGNVRMKFLEVPQIVWGLNNQKIAFARACLTARMFNRSLLMPSLSASLFYKEIDQLQPISFDKVFDFERFNNLCDGFVRVSRYSDIENQSNLLEVQKGSGRRWTIERDLDQLKEFSKQDYDGYEIIRIMGKNPFLWHDHWPVSDYAKVFECLVLVDEISKDANDVVSRIREFGSELKHDSLHQTPYVAIHMRIEKDWMIHCKKLEQRSNVSNICSSKEEIITRVANIPALKPPTVVYLAVSNELLDDDLILNGWKEGLYAVDKKRLGLIEVYKKHPYLIQAAIDYEVCLRADVFIGNSYSTFSSLLVLDRTQKIIKTTVVSYACRNDIKWPSYAYNIEGESGGPQLWMTNLSDSSLHALSYGSNSISC